MKLTCSKCFGNKTYRGMGSMIVKCEPCNGLGFVDIDITTKTQEASKKVTKEKRNAKEAKREETEI